MEYISKQSVIDYLNGYLHSLCKSSADSLFDRGQRRALTNSIQDILAVKAADVQPIKHGKWLSRCEGDIYDFSECSECGNIESCETPYCAQCGARMDLKDGDAE